VEILFLFAGLPFVAIGILIIVWEMRGRAGGVAAPATIVGYSTDSSGDYHSVAEYVGIDGVHRYVESSVGASAPLGSVGDSVTVLLKPADPDQAIFQSSLSLVLGAVIAAMGVVCCAVFFATFRPTRFSLGGAAVVTVLTAYKLLGLRRESPLSLQEWLEKRKDLGGRVYTDATKGEIRWANREVVDSAIAKQQKTNRFAVPILLVVGIGLLVLGVHLYRTTNIFLAKALPATGRIVDLAANHSSDSTTYAPVVEFQVDGHRYKFKDSISSNPPSYRTGEIVKVLYDPDRPQSARIDRGRWNTAVPLFVCAFGALLCFAGVWAESLRRRPRAS
jgi:hypothetical protein